MAANAISKEGHGCIHSQLTSGHEQTSLTYRASSLSSHGRTLTVNGREPIRVHVEKMTSSLSAELDELLYDEVLPAAVSYINSALAVTPVSGQLLFSRNCGGTWNTGTPNVCALEAPNECGSSRDVSRATIPDALLGALRVCSTCSGDSCDELPPGLLADPKCHPSMRAQAEQLQRCLRRDQAGARLPWPPRGHPKAYSARWRGAEANGDSMSAEYNGGHCRWPDLLRLSSSYLRLTTIY